MSSTKSTTEGTSAPWAAQQPYLQSAFSDAQSNYNTNMAQGAYSGNYVAPTNQNQYDAALSQYNNANNQGASANNGIMNAGFAQMGQGYAGADSAMNGLGALAVGNTGQNLVSTGQGITDSLNRGVQNQVNQAMQVANQNAAQSTIPNLYAGAARSGDLNSDRTAVSQGVVNQGLQQTAMNMAGSLEAQNQATGLAQAYGLTGQNAGMLSAQGGLGAGLGNSGLGALGSSINNWGALANQAQAGADKTQALDQSGVNNQMQKYTSAQNFSNQQLAQYMAIVGGQNWGAKTSGSTTSTPSTLSSIGGAMSAIGSLFKGSGGLPMPLPG